MIQFTKKKKKRKGKEQSQEFYVAVLKYILQ
jgi:hypothetical protein